MTPRISEPECGRPPAILVEGGLCDPLKGWARKDTALADPFSIHQPAVGCTGLGLQLIQMFQTAQAPQVGRGVDHGLDAQCPAFFEVLLDP